MRQRCNRCGRWFGSERGLRMHLREKHRVYYHARFTAPWMALAAVIGLGLMLAMPYLSAPRTPVREDLLNTYLTGHEKLAMHIHQRLRIFIDGAEVKVPANIGILPDGRTRVIHTHDETGTIHVESPVPAEFTFGDFLKVWGKNLTSRCFDGYCGRVRFTANGLEVADPSGYVLRDGDELVLEVFTSSP